MSDIKETELQAGSSSAARALNKEEQRRKLIIRTSIIGILANVCLAALKAFIGVITHSIAITLDAVNNLSDAASSVVTIVGTKLAARQPDRDHPFGHGRIEYLSALIISIIVLYAGISSLSESIRKIVHPEVPEYTAPVLFVILAGVAVKIIMGRYVKSVGERVNSDSLVNSGQDAILDSVISASTLAAALIFIWKGISLEAWLAAVISVVIIKSGFDMMRETLSRILGERADAELARAIKQTVRSFPDVSGVYDLVLHNYGPETYNGSLHIEVPDTYSASKIDELIREITAEVYEKYHVILTAVGVYSVNTSDSSYAEVRDRIQEIVMGHDHVLQMHGFLLNKEKKTIRFDIIISFDAKDRWAVYSHICREVQQMYPDYSFEITMDTDFSEP